MTLTTGDLWVIATAALASVACAVPGVFLVLRRMSMLGDAISHAILPGIAIAYLATGSRSAIAMLVGAGAVGLLTAVGSRGLQRATRLPEDATLGVVFSSLFALGVVLVSWAASRVDLDPGCVLYGLIEFVAISSDRVGLMGVELPRQTATLGVACGVNLLLVAVFFKELRLVCFDEGLARALLGVGAGWLSYGLLGMVAATTVVSFEAVGSILVVTMLVAPAATAQLLTDRLGRMVAWAAGLGVIASVLGHVGAIVWNTSTAGMISVVAGLQFALAVLLAPRYGVLARKWAGMMLRVRIAGEDVLGALYRRQEGRADGASELPAGFLARVARWRLRRAGLIAARPSGGANGTRDRWSLTTKGIEAGRALVRSHRLWEGYLAKHLALPVDHLHEPSHRVEHYVTSEMREELAREVGTPTDPHGRAIPGEE